MLQNSPGQSHQDESRGQRGQGMQLASWLQKRRHSRSAQHAWGLSPVSSGWYLTGLSRSGSAHPKLHTFQLLAADLDELGDSGVSYALRQLTAAGGVFKVRPRLHVGLAMDQVVGGVLTISAVSDPSEWEADVQVEAARALGLEPPEVSFDWQVDPLSDGVVIQLHWVACRQDAVHVFKQCVRRSGGQLASVEPVQQAAQRAASCLMGGIDAVITRPIQDWQFDLAMLNDRAPPQAASVHDLMQDQAFQDAMQTPLWPCLVSAGLALKAWS